MSGRTTHQISSRGERRRQRITDAAAAILLRDGFAAVSHRSVAQHAQVSLSATTYYFDSLDDLVAEAVTDLAEAWLAAARAVVAALPARIEEADLAEVLVRVAAPTGDAGGDVGLITFYGRYLEAARHPGLRPLVARYDDHLDSLLSDVLRRGGFDDSPATARLVLAVVDGATIRALAAAGPLDDVPARVSQLLAALRSQVADMPGTQSTSPPTRPGAWSTSSSRSGGPYR